MVDSIDLEVLHTVAEWQRERSYALFGTVVRTWGSAPRPIGSTVAIRGDGRVVGSVSGGCVEDDIVSRLQSGELRPTRPQLVTYGVLADEAHRFGLPCGGTLQIVFEPVTPSARFSDLLETIERERIVLRSVDLATGSVTLEPGKADVERLFDGNRLVTSHGTRHRLLIIGAGPISAVLAHMAQALDYHVTICDPRDDYMSSPQPRGVTLTRHMPDDVVLEMRPDAHTAIVALTHDPKLDDMALLEALRCEAFYVGAIGSRSNQRKRRERLKLFDLTDDELDRLRGPVGLYLGARTPAEIAVSIIAEMTAMRNGVELTQTHDILRR